MKIKSFFSLIANSFRDVYKNPFLLAIAVVLWALITFLSKFSALINSKISNSVFLIISLVIFSIVLFCVLSFFLSGLITISATKKINFKDFYRGGTKFLFGNLIMLLLIALITTAIGRIADRGAFYIGNFLKLSLLNAQITFFLIYFIGLLGFLIFFTFSCFYLTVYNLKIRESIKKSFKLVKREYLPTLTITVVLVCIVFFVYKLPKLYSELLEYALVLPVFIQIFTNFVLEKGK